MLTAELAGRELLGVDDLERVRAGALRRSRRVGRGCRDVEPLRVDAVGDSLVLSVHVPFTERDDVGSAAPTRSCSCRSVRTGARCCCPTASFAARSAARTSRATGSKWSSCDRRPTSHARRLGSAACARTRPSVRAPRTVEDSGDPIEHLWSAAHEFLAAARAVIDAADAVVLEQQRTAAAPRAPRLRRIDVE